MPARTFIQVILPLRLEWEPYYGLPEDVQVHVGDRVRVLFARKEYVGAVSAVDVKPQTEESRILPILGVEEGLPKVLPEEIKFWRAVSDYYLCTIGEVYKAAYPALKLDQEEVEARVRERLEARLERLKEKAEKARRDDTRERYQAEIEAVEAQLRGEKTTSCAASVTLSPTQETAARTVRKAFSDGKTVLLHGVTGSGKTEVYLQAIAAELEAGRGAIVMVPEIALTPQTVQRFASRFGGCVAVLHSALSDGERYDEWHRIRSGEARVVIGPRSAVFAPVASLGLVVVDEEHETSYKQEETPRYNARDVAVMRGAIEGAKVVLGSATPSLETWANVARGKYAVASMAKRAGMGRLPAVSIVDMEEDRRGAAEGQGGAIFSRRLLDAIGARLDRAGEALLDRCFGKE